MAIQRYRVPDTRSGGAVGDWCRAQRVTAIIELAPSDGDPMPTFFHYLDGYYCGIAASAEGAEAALRIRAATTAELAAMGVP